MSFNPNGTAFCDRCGQSAGHGSIVDAVVISDLNFTTGAAVNYHFCRTLNRLNDGIRCCDVALNPITLASLYPHVGASTDNGVGGGGGGGPGTPTIIIRAF